MRKLAIVLGLIALAAAPLAAGGIGVGYSTWDTDTADDDQGATIKVEVDLGTSVDFEARASFFDSLNQIHQGVLYEIEATPLDMGFNYDFLPDGRVNPFVALGATFLFISPNEGTPSAGPSRPRSQEEFGWYGGLGLDFVVTPGFTVYLEALHRDASGEIRGRDLGTAPAGEFEVDFGGTSGAIGLMFSW